MSTLDPREIRSIFDAALDATPAQRSALLDERCGSNAALRREVETLLAVNQDEHELLDTPGAGLLGEVLDGSGMMVGRQIGAYRLERLIASGGMGAVYLAERADDQFQQTVAIKLIRHGLIDEVSVRRFRAERQTLARLDHPYIGRLLDGGVTEAALPYLVMEYVEGQPVDVYCDQRRFTVEQRVRLFLRVCEAVQYAHRNLIVHRDLKPGNIFVTDSGDPKLLDFGIAKALESDSDEHRNSPTLSQQRLLTPQYASPEQIRGGPITTASDIYSLGVVLFELLVGRRPYRVSSRSLHDIERAVCEQEPERPSTAVHRAEGITDGTTSVDRSMTPDLIGQQRGVEPSRLQRRLRGDLDAIVLKALHKDPSQRYASVEQLASDLRNHLAGLPIVARPSSHVARAWKLVKRHRYAMTAASLLFLSLLIGITGIAAARSREKIAAARAREEAENARVEYLKSQQVVRFLKNVLTAGTPQSLGRDVTMREVLEQAEAGVTEEFGDDPEVESAVHTAIGEAYVGLGQYDRAEPHVRRALQLQEDVHRGDHLDVARGLRSLGILLYQLERFDEAEEACRAALEIDRRLLGPRHRDVATDLNNLGAVLRGLKRLDEAETLLRAALEQRRELADTPALEAAETLNNLGNVMRERGDLSAAEDFCREALSIRQAELSADHPLVTQSLDNLAVVLASRKQYQEAAELLTRSLKGARERLGPDHPHLTHALTTLASVHFLQNDFASAEPMLREALRIRQATFPKTDPSTIYTQTVLGRCLMRQDKLSEAETVLLDAARNAEQAANKNLRGRAGLALVALYERMGNTAAADAWRSRLKAR